MPARPHTRPTKSYFSILHRSCSAVCAESRASSNMVPKLSRAPACGADALHMAVVCAAAAAKHIDMRKATHEVGVLGAELLRVADVELRCVVEFCVAAARGIGANSAQACEPGAVPIQDMIEMRRMSAVDHVVGRPFVRRGVHPADGFGKSLAAWQAPVGFHGERNHAGHAFCLGGSGDAFRLAAVGHGKG